MAKLKLFAGLKEAAGVSEAEIEAATTGTLLQKACEIYGFEFAAQVSRATVAVNGAEISKEASMSTPLGAGDEVALLPPVSGGSIDRGSQGGDLVGGGLIWTGALAGAIFLASWASSGALAGFTAFLSAGLTFALAGRMANHSSLATSLVAAAAAGGFPLWLWAHGEKGLMEGGAVAVLTVAAAVLVARPVGTAVATAAALLWLPLYFGFGLSYVVLIRQQNLGPRLILCVSLIMVAYRVGIISASRVRFTLPDSRMGTKSSFVAVRIAGAAAAEVAAMVSVAFLEEPFTAGPLAVIALVVALSAMLGEAGGRMIRTEVLKVKLDRSPWPALDTWLIALPAFFYGFRLYLT